MRSPHCRASGIVLSCLLGLSFTPHVRAEDSRPASASSSSSIGSPIVSFGTLPALQVATPIPGSPHVPGDFNGDGTSDLLWFNPLLSQVGYWAMTATVPSTAGGGVTRTGVKTYNVTPGYFVGAVGDFNDDGYADLVFTSAKRDLWLWTNNEQGGWTSSEIGSYPDQWQLIGAGDVDGDGYDDLLWLDPSECKFAYWTMRGAARTGYKIIDIACGYYPMGVGYYAPSNRISILWTSAAKDLYIWDSTPSGFASYNLTPYISLTNVWTIGGGFMGQGIGVESHLKDSSGFFYTGEADTYTRIFDARGNQTDVQAVPGWSGGLQLWQGNVGSAGYVIQGNGVNKTGLYMLDQANGTINTNGLPSPSITYSGTAPLPPGANSWTYPIGWYVVGAPVNGTMAPPWL